MPQVSRSSGRDLTGRRVHLPADLPGDPAVLVAVFTENQQRDIDLWVKALPGADVLEVVLIPASQERRRLIIEGGMALYLRDPAVRELAWCLYGDLDAFLDRLGVPDRSEVLAMVASRRGVLHALATGPPTAASRATSTAALP